MNDMNGYNEDVQDDNEENNKKTSSLNDKASLYSKLIHIGLNDDMIGQAITHIKFKENPNVIKEGYLQKESVHLKKVRQRWMVLKGKYLYSYKDMQVYDDPTEIFDLKLYRTAKMVHNSKISGQFELISIKQEKRVFFAQNKHEMNEWIKCIKKVILFSKDFSNKCRSLRSCPSARRINNLLRLYSHYNGYNNGYLRHIASYKQLINDYYHILDYHYSNKSCELIQKTINVYCNINQCQYYKRNNRIREQMYNDTKQNDNKYYHEINVYRDVLDTIHCTILHSFDNGFKIKHKQLQLMINKSKQKESKELKNENDCYHDNELKELKDYLLLKKQRLLKVRGQNNRFLNNKFFCRTIHSKPLNEEKKNDYDYDYRIDIQNQCEFGVRFVYSQNNNCKSSTYYVAKKYDNFKFEIMDNIFCPLEISKFIETHIKANLLLSQSDSIKQIKSDGNNMFGIESDALLCLENIMALIFYCDFDILTSHFISTYYPTDNEINETELMERHREYCIWGKLLNETVQCFGNPVNDSKIEKYYVCASATQQYFDSFMIKFCRPTSMTTKLHISTLFCPDSNGIILEMKKTNFYIGELLRSFDCSIVSSFSNETEMLFIGGCQSLQLVNVRSMAMNQCYREFIQPFMFFQKIVHGKDILQYIFETDYLIISNLISSKIINKKNKKWLYICQCFDKFCIEQKIIRINLKCLYNFHSNFIHLKCPNLLLFDNLSILFKNCETIIAMSTGAINSLYLSYLLVILQHINTNKYANTYNHKNKKKLKKIVLTDVADIKLSDSEFLKYTNLINDKVQWMLEQTDESILTLTKCVLY